MPKDNDKFLSQVKALLTRYTLYEDDAFWIQSNFKYEVLAIVKKEDPAFFNKLCKSLDATEQMILKSKVKPGDYAMTLVYGYSGNGNRVTGRIKHVSKDGLTAAMETEDWGLINLPVDFFTVLEPEKGGKENEAIYKTTEEISK